MGNKFKKGQRVWWNDPAGETSGYYVIESDIEANLKEAMDDGTLTEEEAISELIVLISNGNSEAEVFTHELEPVYEGEFEELTDRYDSVHIDLRSYIRQKIRAKGGRILIDLPDGLMERGFYYKSQPGILTLDIDDAYQPVVCITDLYIDEQWIIFDGIELIVDGYVISTEDTLRGHSLPVERYYDIAKLISLI